MYRPRPIDTRAIELPDPVEPLVEKLAEHVHDVWASGRLGEGWTHGPERDDAARRHPGLVAYAELSEGEKDYDRRPASMATLLGDTAAARPANTVVRRS